MLSRIDPETHKAIHPHRDYYRLQRACVSLERDLGLTQERHTPSTSNRRTLGVRNGARNASKAESPSHAAARPSITLTAATKNVIARRNT
jgi:hypothetical protein